MLSKIIIGEVHEALGVPFSPFGMWLRSAQKAQAYKTYVDLVPGQWTYIKILAKSTTASLYVNPAEQPDSIVDDLKQPITTGHVTLWVG